VGCPGRGGHDVAKETTAEICRLFHPPALVLPGYQVMPEGVDARIPHIGIRRQIVFGIEPAIGVSPLVPAEVCVVHRRIKSGPRDVRMRLQVESPVNMRRNDVDRSVGVRPIK